VKKALTALFLAGALLTGGMAQAHHKPDHERKKDETTTPVGCADGSAGWDVVHGGGTYTGVLFDFFVEHAAPTCPDVTYVLHIVDGLQIDGWASQLAGTDVTERDMTELVAPIVRSGDGALRMQYDETVVDDDPSVCVYTETIKDGVVLDRAPDVSCSDVDPGSGGRSYD
jgi:hypothetical protein